MSRAESPAAEAEHVSQSVVEAVADVLDATPDELDRPLYEVVDPDALERVFTPVSAGERRHGRIVFAYGGCEVTVFGDGTVTAERLDV